MEHFFELHAQISILVFVFWIVGFLLACVPVGLACWAYCKFTDLSERQKSVKVGDCISPQNWRNW